WTLKDDASGVDKVMSFDEVKAPVACASAANALCDEAWLDYTIELHGTEDAGVADAGEGAADAGAAERDAGLVADASEPAQGDDDGEAEPGDEGDAGEPAARAPRDRCQFGTSAHADLAPSALA